MRTILTIATLCILVQLKSQDQAGLVITYDLFENTVTYTQNGNQINHPEVKNGENIYVVVEEYNPYIHKLNLDSKQINYNQNSSQYGVGQLEGSFGSNTFGGVSQLLGGLNMGDDIQGTLSSLGSSRGQQSAEAMKMKANFFNLADELLDVEDNINNSYALIKKVQSQSKAQDLALQDIYALKTNSLIRPSRIKELIQEEIEYAFAIKAKEAIKLADVFHEDENEKMELAINEHELATGQYRILKDKWRKLSLSPILIASNDRQLRTIKSSADSIYQVMQLKLDKQKNIEIKQPSKTDQSSENKLIVLRRTYEEIQNDIFTYKFPPVQASGKSIDIKLSIDELQDDGTYKEMKALNQNVEVTGEWKISAGLGLAFSRMNDPTYAYEVIENKIVADPLDDFVPMFTSFVHGHKITSKQVSIGTTFGIGFPLQANDGNLSLSFFLGPSLIIGKSEKVFFTGGIMGSKTQRLAGGFHTGDNFNGISSTLPMRSRYELGYFIAFSYVII